MVTNSLSNNGHRHTQLRAHSLPNDVGCLGSQAQTHQASGQETFGVRPPTIYVNCSTCFFLCACKKEGTNDDGGLYTHTDG